MAVTEPKTDFRDAGTNPDAYRQAQADRTWLWSEPTSYLPIPGATIRVARNQVSGEIKAWINNREITARPLPADVIALAPIQGGTLQSPYDPNAQF